MGIVLEKGPTVGTFRECEIPAYIKDDQGRRWNYDGLAPERPPGSKVVYMDDLSHDEALLYPGLLYKLQK